MAKDKKKKGILGKAIDAVSARDEKEAAEEAEREATTAKRRASAAEREAAVAEAKAKQEARKRAKAEEKVKAAEREAAKAKAEAEKLKRQVEEEKREERQKRIEAMEARREEEAKPSTYVVQAGDSLSKIAKNLLGDASRWPEIFELNKDQIRDPNLIRVGQELKIPKE
ncbi:MAG: LysM peptidoglycan-binding domain-containing protein [Anaerolineae bacterium]